jgi:hypothetical protein
MIAAQGGDNDEYLASLMDPGMFPTSTRFNVDAECN